MVKRKTTSPGRRFALISVHDKTGIARFAKRLQDLGFSLLSTGGTKELLQSSGLDVTAVSDYTGSEEIMGGRVKTLHPRIHGGILGRVEDAEIMRERDIPPIDVVVVNLYPFEAVTADDRCSLEDAIENIDIGGPTMVRAAAKNFQRVTVIVDPSDYKDVAAELQASGSVAAPKRFQLAAKAFAHTARYDGLVAAYLSRRLEDADDPQLLPACFTPQFSQLQALRYGENPHQAAAFYADSGSPPHGMAAVEQLQGKDLSYNNINDADAAIECAGQFGDDYACVIVKHANPCGVAVAADNTEAYQRAFATDPVSSFGGIIAFSQAVGRETAAAITGQQFVEVVIAPGYSDGAREQFAVKPNLRLLLTASGEPAAEGLHLHQVSGGLLVQQKDSDHLQRQDCRCVSRAQPDERQWRDLLFAWKVARMVKSNAIVYAADGRTLGIGAGQMSRVDSARIARWKAADAGLDLVGAVMASDAFFPFRDSIDTAAAAGVSAVIQPGGSMRDEEVIAAADEHGITMLFTGVRHFRH